MENSTIKLMQLVGSRLSGKSIYVRERHPATIGNAGEIHRDADGQLIIDLSPDIPDEKRLWIFLHEVGHAKCHNFLRTDQYRAEPKSQAPQVETGGDALREDTAEKWAGTWHEYALKHAHPKLSEIDPFLAAITALLGYQEVTGK